MLVFSKPRISTSVLGVWTVGLIALGCRTYLDYSGQPLTSVAEAREFIVHVLESQHGDYAPIEVEVTEEKLRVLRQRLQTFGPIPSVIGPTVIYFADIGVPRLSKKSGWFAITILAPNGHVWMHVYTADLKTAERFIDALVTMKRAAAATGGTSSGEVP